MESSFLTVAEVAQLLQLNQQTVRNWIDRGELEAVRVGSRRVRIRQNDLDRFLTAGSMPVGDETEQQPRPVTPLEDPIGQLWARFGKQVSEADGFVAEEDPAKLIAALRSLGEAANSLADELETKS